MSPASADGDTPVPEPSGQDDVKRRFKEALDRKQGRHTDAAGAAESGDRSRIHGSHGPAHQQRQFRRKSG